MHHCPPGLWKEELRRLRREQDEADAAFGAGALDHLFHSRDGAVPHGGDETSSVSSSPSQRAFGGRRRSRSSSGGTRCSQDDAHLTLDQVADSSLREVLRGLSTAAHPHVQLDAATPVSPKTPSDVSSRWGSGRGRQSTAQLCLSGQTRSPTRHSFAERSSRYEVHDSGRSKAAVPLGYSTQASRDGVQALRVPFEKFSGDPTTMQPSPLQLIVSAAAATADCAMLPHPPEPACDRRIAPRCVP